MIKYNNLQSDLHLLVNDLDVPALSMLLSFTWLLPMAKSTSVINKVSIFSNIIIDQDMKRFQPQSSFLCKLTLVVMIRFDESHFSFFYCKEDKLTRNKKSQIYFYFLLNTSKPLKLSICTKKLALRDFNPTKIKKILLLAEAEKNVFPLPCNVFNVQCCTNVALALQRTSNMDYSWSHSNISITLF